MKDASSCELAVVPITFNQLFCMPCCLRCRQRRCRCTWHLRAPQRPPCWSLPSATPASGARCGRLHQHWPWTPSFLCAAPDIESFLVCKRTGHRRRRKGPVHASFVCSELPLRQEHVTRCRSRIPASSRSDYGRARLLSESKPSEANRPLQGTASWNSAPSLKPNAGGVIDVISNNFVDYATLPRPRIAGHISVAAGTTNKSKTIDVTDSVRHQICGASADVWVSQSRRLLHGLLNSRCSSVNQAEDAC